MYIKFLYLLQEDAVVNFIKNNWVQLLGYIGTLIFIAYKAGQIKKGLDLTAVNYEKIRADYDEINADVTEIKLNFERQKELRSNDRETLKKTLELIEHHVTNNDIHVNPKYDYAKHEDLMRRLGSLEDALRGLSSDVIKIDKKIAIIFAKHGDGDDA